METLLKLPNIGSILAQKLKQVGVHNEKDLHHFGTEKCITKIAALENGGVCISMLYAIEGAIQNIRWHALSEMRKQELKEFYYQFRNQYPFKS